MVGTKLDLNEDLTPAQQRHKSEMWPLFNEANVAGKPTELFVDDTQICPPSFI